MRSILVLLFSIITGVIYSQQYNVVDYGAISDGKTVSTHSINKAIEDCHKNGGGDVYFPSGKFVTGTVFLKDNVHLYLEKGCTIQASTSHHDFPRIPGAEFKSEKDRGGWFALIYANNASNIGIRGYGTIDGQGSRQKPRPELLGGDLDGRPRNILFVSCKNVTVETVCLRNSGMWNQHYLDCEDVIVDRIHVYNHSNRNNDGIDIDCCRRFILSNSVFDSDDDGITLKTTGLKPCENITVTNCIVSSQCNPIKMGTESLGGFKNISISNCVITPSRCKTKAMFNDYRKGIAGISIEMVDGGEVNGISISNISINGTMCPLYIRLGNRGRKISKDAPKPPVGIMRNISISNIVAYNTGNFSSSITGIPGYYVENVSLNNIQLHNIGGVKEGDYLASFKDVKEDEKGYPQPTVWGNLPSSGLFLRHVKNLQISNITIGSDSIDSRTPIMGEDLNGISIRQSQIVGESKSAFFFEGNDVLNCEIEKPLGWKSNIWIGK